MLESNFEIVQEYMEFITFVMKMDVIFTPPPPPVETWAHRSQQYDIRRFNALQVVPSVEVKLEHYI